MHVLGALEEQDPLQSKLQACEAWEALAKAVTLEKLLWVIQCAHFVDALDHLEKWLLVSGRRL